VKAKIVHLTVALVLALSLSLMMAVPAMANSVSSSTMHFEGSLTAQGDGYIGTIAMTAGEYYVLGGPGQATYSGGGVDKYAKAGGTAYLLWPAGPVDDNWTIGGDHDPQKDATYGRPPGGSSPQIDWCPDLEDWEEYRLELTANHWYLRYQNTVYEPMSGTMTWNGGGAGYARETDTGWGANAHPGELVPRGGGPQAWDCDWPWGIEVFPLQYPGFNVQVTDAGGGNYHVTLTPAAAPGGGGCFIATAAYGTESAEEIDVLRAFRDEVLLESALGSQLVEWYYQTSPPVADFISENDVLKTLVRELVIDPIVSVATFTQGIWGD